MKYRSLHFLTLLLLLLTNSARADHHGWQVAEAYSNADGSLQFVEFFSPAGNHPNLTDFTVTATNISTSSQSVFAFPSNLPELTTEGKRLLLATSGFAAEYGITPDYVIADGFLTRTEGSVRFNNTESWTALPANGRSLHFFSGTSIEEFPTPQNFSGATLTLDVNPPQLNNAPGVALQIASNEPVASDDSRIVEYIAVTSCADEQDPAPVITNDLPATLLPDTTSNVTLTCSDAADNIATVEVSIVVNTFTDTDGDGVADDTDSDDDGDGVADNEDVFPLDKNESVDTDGDGIGNNADNDDDNDLVLDAADAFPLDSSESIDTDGDGIGNNQDSDDDGDGVADSGDAFPLDAAESFDTDGDGIGNAADADDDNDGISDARDAFPLDASETLDTDRDGIGNNADSDDDGDGVEDLLDAFPLDSSRSEPDAVDTDGDGEPDLTDSDDDGDGVADDEDSFPLDASESVDTDNDGTGNNADTDDDGDGMPDSYEIAQGFNPLDASDASSDRDGDGASNQAEYQAGSDSDVDDYAPVISLSSPLRIDAKGRLTALPADAAVAVDGKDGEVAIVAEPAGPYESGLHQIVWQAADAAGNVASREQLLEIKPILALEQDLLVTEGTDKMVRARLSGDALEYPVNLPLSVGAGSASTDDYTLPLALVFSAGQETQVSFSALADNQSEGDETLSFTVAANTDVVTGPQSSTTVTITESVLPAQLTLVIRQAGVARHQIDQSAGVVEIEAVLSASTNPVFDWSGSDDALAIDAEDQQLVSFDPAGLAAGFHIVTVLVNDGDTQITGRAGIIVSAGLAVLSAQADTDGDNISDADEGWGDADQDGIPDYQDNNPDASQLPAGATNIQTQTGLRLRLGDAALNRGEHQANINKSDLAAVSNTALSDAGYQLLGSLFDFEVRGLAAPGQTVKVVIPLSSPLADGALYRKFVAGSGWQPFVLTATDQIYSAPSIAGECPPPGSSSFESGLTALHDCIQLALTDGGPNDADAVANQIIRDPGGVVIVDQTPVLSIPADFSVEAVNANGISLDDSGLPELISCSDPEDGGLAVRVSLAGESVDHLPLGESIIQINCEDSGESLVSDSVVVTVVDTTPPALTTPARLEFEAATSPAANDSRIVNFVAGASCTDTVSGSLTVTNNLPAQLGYGAFNVTFSCQDGAGNSVSADSLLIITEPSVTLTGGNSGAGCFIATAAYGSYLDREVVALRGFRDQVLMPTAAGRGLVKWYYSWSPEMAAWIAQHDWARMAARVALTPIVYLMLYPLSGLLLLLTLLLLMRKRAEQH